MKNYFLLIISF